MTIFNLKVNGNVLNLVSTETVATGGVNNIKCVFNIPVAWIDLMKVAVFYQDNKPKKTVALINNECDVPVEVMTSQGDLFIGLYGSNATRVESTTIQSVYLREGSYVAGENTPSPDLFMQLSQIFIDYSVICQTAETNARSAETNAELSKNNALLYSQNSKLSEDNAKLSEQNALISRQNALLSEQNAKLSETKSSQNLADILAMLGHDIATLTGGKLTPSQIPDISINNSFLVVNESQLVTLTAQIGDMAYMETNGEVTALYWLVDVDSTILGNWKKLGLSFVANAGHSLTSDTATNSNMINNHRIVEMTQSEYDVAVKDPDTYYLVN